MERFRLIRLFSFAAALTIAVVLIVSSLSCRQNEEVSDKIAVAVSIPPQVEFVKAVGGDKVDVMVMVPPGANLHTYEPRPNQVAALAKADLYAKVGSGVEFELAWMDKLIAVNRNMLIVNSADGVELTNKEPHIWLSPLNAQTMVWNIYNGLVQIDPVNKAYYEQNRDAYLQELTTLDRDITDSLSGLTNREFMVYHPAFGYLARDYNLTMIPIEKEGKEPTAADIADLIEYGRESNIKVIFAAPQFNPKSAEVIADEIGGRVVFIDPLAENYIQNMRVILDELVQAMMPE